MERGALMAISINMDDFGELTGEMVADVLEGATPAEMAVRVVSEGDLLVNRSAASKFGLDLETLRARGAVFH